MTRVATLSVRILDNTIGPWLRGKWGKTDQQGKTDRRLSGPNQRCYMLEYELATFVLVCPSRAGHMVGSVTERLPHIFQLPVNVIHWDTVSWNQFAYTNWQYPCTFSSFLSIRRYIGVLANAKVCQSWKGNCSLSALAVPGTLNSCTYKPLDRSLRFPEAWTSKIWSIYSPCHSQQAQWISNIIVTA